MVLLFIVYLLLTLRTLVGWSERQQTPTISFQFQSHCWSSLALTPTYQITKVRKVSYYTVSGMSAAKFPKQIR
jgi:hypothetical protein